jgi:predicted negative regulator of RcsB-dependent stress response
MHKQRGFLQGLYLYAAIGVLVVVSGLAAWGYYQKARAEQAVARVNEVIGQRDRAIAAAKANEEAAKRLIQLNEALNAAIVERDKRAKALEEARRKIGKELDELKATLSAEDQDCLSRSLPDPLAHLLRGGPGDRDPDRASASAGSPASPVPHLEPQ